MSEGEFDLLESMAIMAHAMQRNLDLLDTFLWMWCMKREGMPL